MPDTKLSEIWIRGVTACLHVTSVCMFVWQVLKCGNLAALQAVHASVLAVTDSAVFGVSTVGSLPNGLYTIQSVGTAAEKNAQCGTYLATNPCGATGPDMGDYVQSLTNQNTTYIVWNVTGIGNYNTYYIRGAAREACGSVENFLSAIACNTQPTPNLVDTYLMDDGSGRQQWQLVPTNVSNTFQMLVGGRAGCNQYLSTTVCSGGPTIDLYNQDDGSGRQQWRFSKVG